MPAAAQAVAQAAPQVRERVLPAPEGGSAATRPEPEPASGLTEQRAARGRSFMAVAANSHAVDAGYAMLERGGSAVDAAIAVQMVLNLVEPQSSGIGGGAFLLHFDAADRNLTAYDGRETAPSAVRPDNFLGADGRPAGFFDAVIGGRSVGVPGVLRALQLAHQRHGRLPWAALFEPAIRLAEGGFPISRRLHSLLTQVRFRAADSVARRHFYGEDGNPKPAGFILRNPELAASLRAIAAGGADVFYSGGLARDIADATRAAVNPGRMSEQDIAGYQARQREPVCGDYRVWRICGMPPPSSGGTTVLAILGILERHALARMARTTEAVHLIAEAGRLAYADRDRYLADPDFFDVPVRGLLDQRYLAARAALISPGRSLGRAAPGEPKRASAALLGDDAAPELPATSHLSIVDARGNAVSMSTSIEFAFGSQIMVRGFLLNNQMTDFSFLQERDGRPVANRIEPGKRPRSAMSPTMVFDRQGRLVMVLGSAGGSAIINHVAKTLIASLDWDMDLQDAVSLSNFGSRNGPTELERGAAAQGWSEGLRALGHDVRLMDMSSGVHAIRRAPGNAGGGWIGAADPRREGAARGDPIE
ncbi:MAG: gamma-glutamyltransferase [Betaproteobacteria bacterium]|nr:gamma-glutamyltransferase [Betaproteobacteria bacterium]